MIITEWTRFIKLIIRITFSSALPFYWDDKSNQLRVLKRTSPRLIFYYTGVITFFIRIILMEIIAFRRVTSGENHPIHLTVQTVFFSIGAIFFQTFNMLNFSKRKDVTDYVNSLCKFQNRSPGSLKSTLRNGDVLSQLVMGVGCLTSIFAPIFTVGFILVKPCMEPFLGAALLDCSKNYLDQIWGKLLFAAFELWMNTIGYTNIGWNTFIILFPGIRAIFDHLERIRSVGGFRKGYVMYRRLQIVTILFNKIHQRGILPVLQLAVIGIPAMCLFICVAFHSQIPVLFMLLLLMIAVDAIVAIEYWIFGLAGSVHNNSERVLDKWAKDVRKDKLLRRQRDSLHRLKIMFGSNSFIERSTSLLFIHFTLDKVVYLLLGKK